MGGVTPNVGPDVFAVLVFAVLGVVVGAAMLIFSEVLGPKRRDPEKNSIYECGVPLLDSARHPFSVKFYLVSRRSNRLLLRQFSSASTFSMLTPRFKSVAELMSTQNEHVLIWDTRTVMMERKAGSIGEERRSIMP